MDVEGWSQALSSDVSPGLWASWDAAIWSLSGVAFLANWHEVLEGVSLAILILLLALSKGLVSLSLVSVWLVAVHTSVQEALWALVGADGVADTDEVGGGALFVGEPWSSRFAVSGTVNGFASVHGSLGGWVAALDGGAGGFGEGVEASDQVGEHVGFSDVLQKSSLLDLGVGLVGDSHFGSGVVSDVAIVDDDLAEAFSDVVSACGGGETDESDQQN